jgi:hypothetical protein
MFSRLLDILDHGATRHTGAMTENHYDRDGYLVLADALSAAEVQALRDEAVRICRGELGAVEGVQPAARTSCSSRPGTGR